MSFRRWSAAQLQQAYHRGETTPSAVAERALEAAAASDRADPPLRAFIALDADDVRAQAAASSERFRAQAPRSPLDGVLVAVKDEYAMRGYPRTCGTSFLGGAPLADDALAVARLREAGAVLFGKTNMYELGAQPSGLNPHHGSTRNPYDPRRDTGGSSAGSAAAVAAGLVPLALGTDSGGSLRIPAALCGVVSIKPSFGRFPTEGVSVLCWSLEHTGPIGATVADVATAFAIGTGEPTPPVPPSPAGRRLRLGVCDAWWASASNDVAHVANQAVDRLVAAGAERVSVELPHLGLVLPVAFASFAVEAAAALDPHLRAERPFSRAVRVLLESGRGVTGVHYVQAQRARSLIAADFARALERADLIVTPTTAITAPLYRSDAFDGGEVDEAVIRALTGFTFPFNLTGLPATSVPCGHAADDMPVGLQLAGAAGDDLLTLAAAAQVEQTAEMQPPAIWHPLL